MSSEFVCVNYFFASSWCVAGFPQLFKPNMKHNPIIPVIVIILNPRPGTHDRTRHNLAAGGAPTRRDSR